MQMIQRSLATTAIQHMFRACDGLKRQQKSCLEDLSCSSLNDAVFTNLGAYPLAHGSFVFVETIVTLQFTDNFLRATSLETLER